MKNDPVVTDLRGLQYTPDGLIHYKLDFDAEWTVLPHREKKVSSPIQWPRMFKAERKIKPEKFKHPQELKKVIPSSYHSFYDNLKC